MDHSTDMGARAILIGSGHYPKDEALKPLPQTATNLAELAEAISIHYIFELEDDHIVSLSDVADNIQIKEELAIKAEEASKTLFIYFSGHIILRKGQLYLATPSSSCDKIHVNGISLEEVIALIRDSAAKSKVVIFDVVFSASGAEMSEKDIYQTESRLRQACDHVPGLQIILTSPQNTYAQFEGEGARSVLTDTLIRILDQGIRKEQELVLLSDWVAAAQQIMESAEAGSPLLINESRENALVAKNQRYLEFQRLKMQGDNFFHQNEFVKAYPAYINALELYPDNPEARDKKHFIEAYQEGQKAFNAQQLEEAIKFFEEARSVMVTEIVSLKIEETYRIIANQAMEEGQFDLAKSKLESLVTVAPDNDAYREQLAKANAELEFSALIDQGDHYYFNSEYAKATEYYDQALSIKDDAKTRRRKAECATFIKREQAIREQLEEKVRQEFAQANQEQISAEIEAEKSRLGSQIEASMRAEFEQEKAQLKSQLEASLREQWEKEKPEIQKTAFLKVESAFWAAISLWNDPNAYKFYLSFFKDGKHREKAEERLGELQQKAAQATADEQAKEAEINRLKEEVWKLEHKIEELNENLEDQKNRHKALNETPAPPAADKPKPLMSLKDLEEEQTTSSANHRTPAPSATPPPTAAQAQPASTASEAHPAKPTTDTAPTDSPEPTAKPIPEADTTPPEQPEKPASAPQPDSQAPAQKRDMLDDLFADNPDFSERIRSMMSGKPKTPRQEAPKQPTLPEEELWAKAQQANTPDAYLAYIDQTTESKYVTDAYFMINKLKHQNTENESDTPEIAQSRIQPVELETYGDDVAEIKTQTEEQSPTANEQNSAEDQKTTAKITVDDQDTSELSEAETDLTTEAETSANMPTTEESTDEVGEKTEEISEVSATKEAAAEESQHSPEEDTEEIKPLHRPNDEALSAEDAEEALWKKVSEQDSIASYYEYINSTVLKLHWKEAKERLAELKSASEVDEQAEWEYAEMANTIDAYQNYIKKYPLGNHYAQAMFKINRLKSKE